MSSLILASKFLLPEIMDVFIKKKYTKTEKISIKKRKRAK